MATSIILVQDVLKSNRRLAGGVSQGRASEVNFSEDDEQLMIRGDFVRTSRTIIGASAMKRTSSRGAFIVDGRGRLDWDCDP